MKSLAIVEDLHVFEYLRPGLLLASVDIAPNQLCSQGLEECFRARVVPAVAPAAHALNETVARGNLLKLTACVLGEFNRSLQHPCGEELRWQQENIESPTERCDP